MVNVILLMRPLVVLIHNISRWVIYRVVRTLIWHSIISHDAIDLPGPPIVESEFVSPLSELEDVVDFNI